MVLDVDHSEFVSLVSAFSFKEIRERNLIPALTEEINYKSEMANKSEKRLCI